MQRECPAKWPSGLTIVAANRTGERAERGCGWNGGIVWYSKMFEQHCVEWPEPLCDDMMMMTTTMINSCTYIRHCRLGIPLRQGKSTAKPVTLYTCTILLRSQGPCPLKCGRSLGWLNSAEALSAAGGPFRHGLGHGCFATLHCLLYKSRRLANPRLWPKMLDNGGALAVLLVLSLGWLWSFKRCCCECGRFMHDCMHMYAL